MKKMLLFSLLLLGLGAGCPNTNQSPSATNQNEKQSNSQSQTVSPTELSAPFDTNDYLDLALEELSAIE